MRSRRKYLQHFAFTPLNLRLRIDTHLLIQAELLDPVNVGTEIDPIAAATLQTLWQSTRKLQGPQSVEYLLRGDGTIQEVAAER